MTGADQGQALTWLLLALAALMLLSVIGWRFGDRLRLRLWRRREHLDTGADFVEDTVVPDRLVRQKVRVGHHDRAYELYVPPPSPPARPLPLVFVFHGGGGSPYGIAQASQMHRLARRQSFLVVYPAGTISAGAGGRSWNAGSAAGLAAKAGVDDEGFFLAMLERLRRDFDVDPQRVYLAGLSNGGMFAYHLACRFPETIAAIAAVATVMTSRTPPRLPVPVLHIHGTADSRVPIDGGGDRRGDNPLPPVAETLAVWRRVNGCSDEPVSVYEDEEARCVRYRSAGRADVEYCVIAGCGHLWPGALRGGHAALRTLTSSFPASEYVWTFFREHPRPAAAAAATDATADLRRERPRERTNGV